MANSKRKCTGCKQRFYQDLDTWRESPVGPFHNSDCQIEYARAQVAKKHKAEAKQKKAAHRKKLIEVKGLGHWIKETQKVVNQYVRLRDKGKPCISCGIYESEMKSTALTGGVFDAGHFRTTGAFPELRFDLRNINGQCRSCNSFNGGRVREQEEGIVNRHGQDRLDWLLSYHKPKHYTIEHLARMRAVLRKRMRMRGWL